MRLLHNFISKFGFSFGGHKACLKHGCKKYCGYNPIEALLFIEKKNKFFSNPPQF
ncbi:hypothetical protein SFC50_25890 [Bacillus infantis]|uniref:hypothetical protein n=1 Tax=Bacillus infantis TaxID=324767 RepID=UPI003982BDED